MFLKKTGIVIACLILALPAFSQAPQQVFDQANRLYRKQSYDSASLLYRQLIDRGYTNAGLYFNTGNACYKMGNPGYAVYYFTKALQEDPGNKVIEHNLRLARLQASNKINQIPTLFFVRWWHALLHFFPANGWLIASIVFFWIFIFLLGWQRLASSAPRRVRWLLIPAALLFCFFLAGAAFSWIGDRTHDTAIIVKVEEPLRTAPDQNSSSIEYLQSGDKVQILDSVDRWKKVRLENGTEGWIGADEMKVL